ncbi:histidine kinase [Agrococcus terreus]|uniref:sensor histidine kinase n=1 Tax=Agrococcus terreus TaxID=574649 RepID=UPI00384FCBBF
MTFTTFARLASRWWPAAIAVLLVLGSLLVEGMDDGMTGLLLLTLAAAALAIARRFALASMLMAASAALLAAASAWNTGWFTILVALAASMLAVWQLPSLRTRLILTAPFALVAVLAISLRSQLMTQVYGVGFAQGEGVILWLLVIAAWGCAVGGRAALDGYRAEQVTEVAVARTTVVESELRDERLRADLTHDFHDVMAHSLAVLAAQAEGLRLSYERHPERIGPVLTTISDTARLSLVEVRQLLERVDDDARRPQPTSADIPGLVAQLRSAGPSVVLHDSGTHGHLSRIADIAAYRIVQESLTNALRHGGPDVDVVVVLTWTGPGLTIAVSSPIRERDALRPAGRGIAGMHERARVAGGSLEIDAEGDRFVVSAHLPYEPLPAGPTAPLGEDQLATLPVPVQPEAVVAPWIVEATRRAEERARARRDGAAADWSTATTIDLGEGLRPASPPASGGASAPGPDGRVPNPMARPPHGAEG